MKQSGILAFAQLLNGGQEEEHLPENIEQIFASADIDTWGWPKDYIKLYLMIYLLELENNTDNTVNLSTVLKVGVHARVLINDNLDFFVRLKPQWQIGDIFQGVLSWGVRFTRKILAWYGK